MWNKIFFIEEILFGSLHKSIICSLPLSTREQTGLSTSVQLPFFGSLKTLDPGARFLPDVGLPLKVHCDEQDCRSVRGAFWLISRQLIHIAIVADASAGKEVTRPHTARIALCGIVLPGLNPGPGNSLSGVTAIDRKRLTADVSGIFRGKKHHRIEQLFWCTGPTKWNLTHPLIQNSSRW